MIPWAGRKKSVRSISNLNSNRGTEVLYSRGILWTQEIEQNQKW